VPFALYAVYRVVVATISTLSLLLRPRLVRQLPWRYFGGVVRSNRRTTLVTGCLAVSVVLFAVGIVEPPVLVWCIVIGLAGIVCSHFLGKRQLERT
jgi:hypothetical protein